MATGPTGPYDPTQVPPPVDPNAPLGALLGDPRIGAALLQTGIGLTQPMAWGDNLFSQLGRSIGQGGEAAAREEKLQQNQDVVDAKTAALEARAGRAGASSDLARERLNLAQSESELRQGRALTLAQLRLGNNYEAYKKGVEKRNADILKPANEPLLTREEFAQKSGVAHLLPPSSTSDTGAGLGGDTGGGSYPVAKPNDPTRQPGVYQTPSGVKRWTGTGWISP